MYPIAAVVIGAVCLAGGGGVSSGYAARAHRRGSGGSIWRHKLCLARGPDFSACTVQWPPGLAPDDGGKFQPPPPIQRAKPIPMATSKVLHRQVSFDDPLATAADRRRRAEGGGREGQGGQGGTGEGEGADRGVTGRDGDANGPLSAAKRQHNLLTTIPTVRRRQSQASCHPLAEPCRVSPPAQCRRCRQEDR